MPKTQAKTLMTFIALLLTISSIYAQGQLTCDKNPSVCSAYGSPGPDCCSRRCVNVASDPLNCGQCAHRCVGGQACCRGTCVDLLRGADNCGACGNKCSVELSCSYGMCSYA